MNLQTLPLAFVAVTGAALAIAQVLAPAQATVDARVDNLANGAPHGAHEPGSKGWKGAARALASAADPLVHLIDSGRSLDRALWQAQLAWTPAEFMLGALLLGLVSATIGWFALPQPFGVLAGAMAVVPFVWLKRRAAANQKAFVGQLPDALLLVVNALKAGHGLLQALRIVSSQVPSPAGPEFGVVLSEINLGLSVERAFLNLAGRTDQVDVDLAVGAILVQRETGGNLAEILTHIQDTLRDRARIVGEVHALTAQGRLSGWVLSLLPVGVGALFTVVNPAYLQPFLIDPRGRIMLAIAGGSQILGILAIRKIVDVKY